MKLRILEGAEAGRELDLDPAGFRIGREVGNDLVLPLEGVSRRHCMLREEGGVWIAEDLDSVNGLKVNGERIRRPTVVQAGDRLEILDQVMLLSAGEPAAAAAPPVVDPYAHVVAGGNDPLPSDRDDRDAPPRQGRPPVAKLALLAVMVLLIGCLAYLIFRTVPGAGDGTRAEGTPPGTTGTGKPPPELSDDELANMVLQQESGMTEAGDGSTSGTGGTPPPRPGPDTTPIRSSGEPVPDVVVETDPPGAAILVDGEATDRVTPAVIRDLAPGRHTLTLTKPGYEPYERYIHVPDKRPEDPYKLRVAAGSVLLKSEPSGAGVWRGYRLLGTTPLMLTDLPAAGMDLMLAAHGHDPKKVTVAPDPARGTEATVALVCRLGTLQVTTIPAGCEVSLGGVAMGTTRVPAGEDPEKPGAVGVLLLPGVKSGELPLVVSHPCGNSLSGKVRIADGETTTQHAKLWVPDTRITLDDGTTRIGMLADRNDHGDIVLSESPVRMQRYFAPQVMKSERLTPAEAAAAVGPSRGSRDGALDTNRPEGEPEVNWSADGPEETTPDPTPAAPATRTLAFSVDELRRLLADYSRTELSHRFADKKMTITGIPSASGKSGLIAVIHFGRQIRCEASLEEFTPKRTRLKAAEDLGTSITVSGIVMGFVGDTITLRECTIDKIGG